MAKKRVFYSFHFNNDFFRTMQVQNMGAIEDDEPVSKNDWEKLKNTGDTAVENWIEKHMKDKECLVLLIGTQTAGRKWINYEIAKAWSDGRGVLGIRIHGLEGTDGQQSVLGANPFSGFTVCQDPNKKQWDSIVPVKNPPFVTGKGVYGHISENIEKWIEDAIKIRKDFKCS